MAKSKKSFRDYIFFTEPKETYTFVLKENKSESTKNENLNCPKPQEKPKKKKKNQGLIKKLITPDIDIQNKEPENTGSGSKVDEKDNDNTENKSVISKDIKVNLDYMKKVYSIPQNGDVIIREFSIIFKDKSIPAFIIFYDGLVDRTIINEAILTPLMLLSNYEITGKEENIREHVNNHILTHNQVEQAKDYDSIIFGINFGNCVIFIDGIDKAFVADVKGWEHRGIERPNTELVLRGPQEGFSEILRVNTALVRKILKDEKLIVEDIIIGKRSETPVSMLYIKDIVNDSLVQEVRRRLKGVKVDYLLDSGELEQLIEDNGYLPYPQVISTERPDAVARYLTDGKVAIIVHGSPFALIVPATLWNLLHSSEDQFIRFPYSNLLRVIRILAVLITLLLPGIYIAITNYHHEMIPTDLLLAIEASREKVPFPSVFELLLMELSFELIREAGIRIPSPIGPTLGIIGALILGQAAVSANIVSPILIIIVAVTGIGSFAVPSFSLAYSFRLQRFLYIVLGATAGFLGISLGLFIQGLLLVRGKSFGVPFMVPYAPPTSDANKGQIFRRVLWKQETRPDDLNVKSKYKQSHISRQWDNKNNNKG